MDNFTCVKLFNNRFEADVAKSFLEMTEIQAFITSDDVGGFYPFLTYVGGVKLMVNKKDADRSKELLETNFEQDSGQQSANE
jgi:hypothetical protein